jgi:hypothetical protein
MAIGELCDGGYLANATSQATISGFAIRVLHRIHIHRDPNGKHHR